jgi:hypothetical protein
MHHFQAKNLNESAAWGDVEYSQFQYKGVSARRQIVLFHNGITVIKDDIKADSSYAGGHHVGVLYHLDRKIARKGTNWWLQKPALRALVSGRVPGEVHLLFYISSPRSTTRYQTHTDTIDAVDTMRIDRPFQSISVLAPLKNPNFADTLAKLMKVSYDDSGKVRVVIPYEVREHLEVTFPAKGAPVYRVFDPTQKPVTLANPRQKLSWSVQQLPLQRQALVRFTTPLATSISWELRNVQGRLLQRGDWQEGSLQNQLSVPESGLLFLKIHGPNGVETQPFTAM